MHKIFFLMGAFILIFFCSCEKRKISSGEIEYAIGYPSLNNRENSLTYMLLPKKQSFIFNEKREEISIKKAMFEMRISASANKNNFQSSYKLDGIKYMNLTDENVGELLKKVPIYEIEYTDEQDTLLGFTIKKAWASHPEIGRKEVWYTNDIELSNANWYTPYRDLKGVLMKYSILQFGVIMEFEAQKFMSEDDLNNEVIIEEKGEKLDLEHYYESLNKLFKKIIK